MTTVNCLSIGTRVSWQSCGKGTRESVIVALASNLVDRSSVAAVSVHWGQMWIALESLTEVSA